MEPRTLLISRNNFLKGLRTFPHSFLSSLAVTQASSDPSLEQRKPRVSVPDGQSHPNSTTATIKKEILLRSAAETPGALGVGGRCETSRSWQGVGGGAPMTLVSWNPRHLASQPRSVCPNEGTSDGSGYRSQVCVWGEAGVRSKRSTGFALRGKGLPRGLAERSSRTHTRGIRGGAGDEAGDRRALAPSRAPATSGAASRPAPAGTRACHAGARPPAQLTHLRVQRHQLHERPGLLELGERGIAPPPGRPCSTGGQSRAASWVLRSHAQRPQRPSSPPRPSCSGRAVRRRRRGTSTGLRHPAPPRPLATLREGRGAKPRPSPRGAAFPGRTPASATPGVRALPPP